MYSLTLKKKVVNMATQDGGADTLEYSIVVESKTYPKAKKIAVQAHKDFHIENSNPDQYDKESGLLRTYNVVKILHDILEKDEAARNLAETLLLMGMRGDPARKGHSSVGCTPQLDLEMMLSVENKGEKAPTAKNSKKRKLDNEGDKEDNYKRHQGIQRNSDRSRFSFREVETQHWEGAGRKGRKRRKSQGEKLEGSGVPRSRYL
jgi:hypothetical protein